MKFISFLFPILVAVTVEAGEHREQGKHEHGHGQVAIAFEGGHGMISLDTPAESILGFEHQAKSEKDKKAETDAFSKLEKSIGEMIVFAPALKCQFLKDKIERKIQGNHSDIEASFHVQCEKSPMGTPISFSFQKVFPKLRDVKVQFIAEKVQKSLDVKKDGMGFEIK
ncbi:MAG: hypothetical protein BroJett040_25920 [Oligoflexia bacterium]|nr:MAG: hypothetical protein BroJett040_25920 [Oligoflexia bacterium]